MKTVASVIKLLLQREPYYGLVACGLVKEFTEKVDTLAVCLDSINYKLLINKSFWDKLDPNMRYGVIKHELLHLLFYHVLDHKDFRAVCPNPDMLNIAFDLEVQSYIDPQYRYAECTAEQLFTKYPNLPRQMGTKFYIQFLKHICDKNSNDSQCSNYGAAGSFDLNNISSSDGSHNYWEDLSETKKELIKNQLEYQIKEAAKQTLKSKGTIPAEFKEEIERLLKPLPPVFNWKSYFRRIIGTAYDIYQKKTRRKESNRFEDSYGLKRKKKHKVLVAIDTSGSVNNEELQEFFCEIRHIWKSGADIKILECDSKISNQYNYKGICPKFVTGRGGTSFLPVIDYYNEHYKEYTALVYFTDGYGDQEQCKPLNKVLWIITSNGNQDGEYPGIVIKIPKKD